MVHHSLCLLHKSIPCIYLLNPFPKSISLNTSTCAHPSHPLSPPILLRVPPHLPTPLLSSIHSSEYIPSSVSVPIHSINPFISQPSVPFHYPISIPSSPLHTYLFSRIYSFLCMHSPTCILYTHVFPYIPSLKSILPAFYLDSVWCPALLHIPLQEGKVQGA